MLVGIKELSLFEMEFLVDIADLKSLRSAARVKDLTPSHASKVLARAEQKIGWPIFTRSANGISLTSDGTELVRGLRVVLRAAEGLVDHSVMSRKVFGMGSMHFLNNELVAPALQKLKLEEQIEFFRLVDMKPDQLVSEGIRGAFSMAVHINELEWPNTWQPLLLGKIRWSLIARKGHPLGQRSTAEKVLEYPFIVPTYWRGDGFAIGSDFCSVPWAERLKGHEASSASGAVCLARSTDHLAFVPEFAARSLLASEEVMEVKVKGWPDVMLSLFLTVKSDVVPQRLFKQLAAAMSKELE